MENSEKIIEGRKSRILKFLKDNKHYYFLAILFFAIIIRIYYFFLTENQPLWWDEADYMVMARYFSGLTPHIGYTFEAVRQILNPFLISLLFGFTGINELLPRLCILVLSFASVIGMYYLGKELFDEKIGLLSSVLMSVFWLNLFFTYRIIVDMHSLTFFTFSAFLFYRYFKSGTHSALYWASALISIGTLFKLSTAFLLPAIFIYALVTEKLTIFKKKEFWIAAGIFLLILSPYLIWGYYEFGGFVLTKSASAVAPESYSVKFNTLITYLKLFPTYLSIPVLIIFILGLISRYNLFLGIDLLIKNKNPALRRDLYLILILIVPWILVSMTINHNEDRYILNMFPAVFIIISLFVFLVFDWVKKRNKFFAILLILLFLIFTINFQIKHADSLIREKQASYLPVKEVGLWIKENSQKEDLIMTKSRFQVSFYSERDTVDLPDTWEEMNKTLSEYKPKYYLISAFESHKSWALEYPQKNNLTLVQAYFADPVTQQQPVLLLYEM